MKHFFLYYKIKYFNGSAIDTKTCTKISQQNISDNLLKLGKKKGDILGKKKGKKVMSIVGQNKN